MLSFFVYDVVHLFFEFYFQIIVHELNKMNEQYYNTKNFNRLGIKYAKIVFPSVHSNSDYDCNGFSED